MLIITQKIDKNDDVLGFMHGWVSEFARHCSLTVISLGKGECDLPSNIKVLSLGKEKGGNRIKYLWRFYKYIWQERHNYKNVLVHMNREYVILGGLFWRLSGKKIILWYNHQRGNVITGLAAKLAHKIFYTSPFAYSAKFKNAVMMPAGIDTTLFKKNENISKTPHSLLYLGRISPIKNIDILIKSIQVLDEEKINFSLSIVGDAPEKSGDYFLHIKKLARNLDVAGKIKFFAATPNLKTPPIYCQNEILVNLTNSGSLDKVVLEAMACGSLVLVSNRAFERIFTEALKKILIFSENNEKDLADKIKVLFDLDAVKKAQIGENLAAIVAGKHSLKILADKIFDEINQL